MELAGDHTLADLAQYDQEQARTEVVRLQRRLEGLRHQLHERLATIRALETDVDALRSELDAIRSTKAWRLLEQPRAIYGSWLRLSKRLRHRTPDDRWAV
jgi:DNA repair exonuclease SbcCD ATPase subunit